MNVKKQILFLLALLTIVPMIAVAVICAVEFVMNSEEMVKANMSDVVCLEAEALEDFFQYQEVNLHAIGELSSVQELLAEESSNAFSPENAAGHEIIADLFAVQIRRQKFIKSIVLADRQGAIEVAADPLLIGSQVMMPPQEMQTGQNDWAFYTNVISNPGFYGGARHIWITVPVYNGSEDVGFVSGAIDLDYFTQWLKKMRLYNNGVICITDGKGGIIVSGGDGTSLNHLPPEAKSNLTLTWKKIDQEENYSGFFKEKIGDNSKLSYYVKIKQNGWRLITTIGQKTPGIFAERAVAATLLIIFGLFLLGVAVNYYLTKIITHPTEKLIETIQKVDCGDMTARSSNWRYNEFGEIAISFDKMMDTLDEKFKQLQVSEERYRIIAEQTDGFIFEYNILNDECYYSSNWIDKIGFQPVGCGFLEHMLSCEFIHSEDLPQANSMLRSMVINEQESGRCEVRMKMNDNRYLWCSMRATAVFDDNQTLVKIIGKITDIDSRKRETEELKISAQRDMLSELYNKITVEHLIDAYLSEEGAEGTHALFIIDIDNFKKINDSLGHLIGDRVIKELSAIVANVFRGSDISGRIGGDELIVLMKNFGTQQALSTKAELLVEAMRHSVENESGIVYRLSCSVGVSIFPRDGRDYTELFTKADAALYTAKANGKNQCYILGD
ncbi:diguanylate cyclase [Oscillospiraceae bacterium PP1C4]